MVVLVGFTVPAVVLLALPGAPPAVVEVTVEAFAALFVATPSTRPRAAIATGVVGSGVDVERFLASPLPPPPPPLTAAPPPTPAPPPPLEGAAAAPAAGKAEERAAVVGRCTLVQYTGRFFAGGGRGLGPSPVRPVLGEMMSAVTEGRLDCSATEPFISANPGVSLFTEDGTGKQNPATCLRVCGEGEWWGERCMHTAARCASLYRARRSSPSAVLFGRRTRISPLAPRVAVERPLVRLCRSASAGVPVRLEF